MFAWFLVLCYFEGGGADSGASNEEVIMVALRWCVCADTRLQLNSSTENLFDSLCAHPSRSFQTRGRHCVITPLPSVRIEQSQKKIAPLGARQERMQKRRKPPHSPTSRASSFITSYTPRSQTSSTPPRPRRDCGSYSYLASDTKHTPVSSPWAHRAASGRLEGPSCGRRGHWCRVCPSRVRR